MADYFRLQLSDVLPEEAELLSSYCFEYGASGVAESLPFSQPREDFESEILPQDSHTLDVFFETPPRIEFLQDLRERFSVSAELFNEPDKDWLAEWKKGFEPFCLVGDVWVVPSWREAPQSAIKIIKLDPGMAFGTGTHDTTRLGCELLYACDLFGKSVLDVGTGSGILAMLAHLQGSRPIEVTEIDPIGREVALENFLKNQMSDIRIHQVQVADVTAQFDIVVANIIDGVLIKIQDALKARVKPGGTLLMTGVLDERKRDFEIEFDTNGLKLEQLMQRGEWWGYRFSKL